MLTYTAVRFKPLAYSCVGMVNQNGLYKSTAALPSQIFMEEVLPMPRPPNWKIRIERNATSKIIRKHNWDEKTV